MRTKNNTKKKCRKFRGTGSAAPSVHFMRNKYRLIDVSWSPPVFVAIYNSAHILFSSAKGRKTLPAGLYEMNEFQRPREAAAGIVLRIIVMIIVTHNIICVRFRHVCTLFRRKYVILGSNLVNIFWKSIDQCYSVKT